jgi:hypothetical protein
MAEKSIGSPSSTGLVFGEVVDYTTDPTQTGQVRVRWNTGTISQSDLKDNELPYHPVLHGSHSASFKGIGGPHTGLIKGSKVVGIVVSHDGQEVLVLGSMASSGNSQIDSTTTFDSNIPVVSKMQENNGKQQPKYGDKNGVVEDYKDESVVSWAQDSGGPERNKAKYAELNDSCGSYGSSEGADGTSLCTLLS